MAIGSYDREELNELLEGRQFRKLRETMSEMNEVDIAEFIEELEAEKKVLVYRMLPKELAADVFSFLEVDDQEHIINSITDYELGKIVEDLYVDDAVDMLEELPAIVVKRVLQNATPETRNLINQFLQYPENSAGSIMTAEYIGLKRNMTVEQAFAYIRENGVDKETIYTCFVTDSKRCLQGVVTVKDLLMNPYDTIIKDIMDENIIYAVTTEDREDVVETFNKYDLLCLPVVDHEDRLVGIVTVDDAVEVMEQEATEDFEKMAAMFPSEKPYLRTGVFELAKNRIPWLLILMFTSILSGAILMDYKEAIQVLPLLLSFVPMLMDTSGNCGNQSSTMVIRGMAVGDIELKDVLRVVWKEFRVGLLCGAVLAAANFVRLILQYPDRLALNLVIVLSLMLAIVLAKIIGCVLPMLAEKMKLDPAIMAAPLITTIVDASSLLIYFKIASMMLHLS
ncbi:magnesium transporter [Laedolimicola sp.]|uniref:magnesium transporter n=1 Tax=Laedolimicola sp. TaxID=2981663 RepID=UPI003F8180AB